MDIVKRLIVTHARIEAAVTGPCVLAVTSALPSDGSGVLAAALAESLILAGHSVLLLRDERPSDARSLSAAQRALRSDLRHSLTGVRNVGTAALPGPSVSRDSQSLASAKSAFDIYRQEHEYTIVDTSAALASGSALALTRSADFVLIAFEAGRAARDADRELARTLHATGTSVLGVVTLERKTIRSFGKERRLPVPPVRPSAQLDDAPQRGSALSSTIG